MRTGGLTRQENGGNTGQAQVTNVILHGMHLRAFAWTLSHAYNHGKNQATTYLPLLGLKKKVTVQSSQ